MKKILIIIGIILTTILMCSCNNLPEKVNVVLHLNGGTYYTSENIFEYELDKEDFNIDEYKEMTPKKETWIFDNWYMDSNFITPINNFIYENQDTIDIYAKWIDEVNITNDNFSKYFSVKSKLNAYTVAVNTNVEFTIKPNRYFDETKNTDAIKIYVRPVLSKNGEYVWTGEKEYIELNCDNCYTYTGKLVIDNSAAGIVFNYMEKCFDYEVVPINCNLFLSHNNDVNITLDYDSIIENEVVTKYKGDLIEKERLPVPENDNYIFDGFYLDENLTNELPKTLIATKDITIYAKLIEKAIITFETNGGTPKESIEQYCVGDMVYVRFLGDDPTKEDYGFLGWYSDPELNNRFEDQIIMSSIMLYAKWGKICTITFETAGGNNKESVTAIATTVPNLGKDPSRSGRAFCGWYIDENYVSKYSFQPITDDITLYARWGKEYYSSEDILEIDIQFEKRQVTEKNVISNKLFVTLNINLKDYNYYHVGISFEPYFKLNYSNTSMYSTLRTNEEWSFRVDNLSISKEYQYEDKKSYDFLESIELETMGSSCYVIIYER